jgi:hypothetical protein
MRFDKARTNEMYSLETPNMANEHEWFTQR